VYTGLSVATVSLPLVYRSFWIDELEQLAALAFPEPAGGLLELVLPQAARPVPMTVAAAAMMMRRI